MKTILVTKQAYNIQKSSFNNMVLFFVDFFFNIKNNAIVDINALSLIWTKKMYHLIS
ncbi:hypothetical protein [Mesomycoplasma conjunctivae]|uniref:hypothetical protein n=1 Tax=Mesomycoplasma conjunctivae TaxID=45361 RepID=UPI003DA6CAAB